MGQDKNEYVPLKDRPPSDRPRERLWQLGADRLSNTELLAILIRTGTEGRSAIQVAEELLSQAGSLSELSRLTPTEIKQIKGMGHANTSTLAATFELARRLGFRDSTERPRLATVLDTVTYFRRHYGAGPPEKFVAFFINRKHVLLGTLEASRGGTNAAVVNPQRIFKDALLQNAKAILLAHNHPGGDLRPSQHDLALTKELIEAGQLFRIPVVEHLIITEGEFLSMASEGLLES